MKGFARMRRLAALAPLLIALTTASGAYAAVTNVGSTVQVLHGTSVIASYPSVDPTTGLPSFVPCTGSTCSTVVPVSSRDFGRVIKWCGGNQVLMGIQNSPTGTLGCQGQSGWSISISATLYDCTSTCVATTPSSPVTDTVSIAYAKAF